MGELRVFHKVPLIGRGNGAHLVFNQWLPEDSASAITVDHDGFRLVISVDRGCVAAPEQVTDDLLRRWINICVVAVLVEVVVADVPEELGAFVIEKENWPRGDDIMHSPEPATRDLAEQYAALGRRIMQAVLHVTNRLVSWANAEHGHYWIATREESPDRMMSNNTGFRASAEYDRGRRVRWCPPNVDAPVVLVSSGEAAIRRDDWQDARSFVGSARRSDAVGEIMGNANALLDSGHARGAVIEAVSALEGAVNRFARAPKIEVLRSDRLFIRTSFVTDLKHLGFTATVRYLLPLLIPATALTPDLLSRVDKAIECRQRIVHDLQRNLDISDAQSHVRAAANLIAVLRGATDRDRPNKPLKSPSDSSILG
jgi:hypothetical protein